MSTVFSALPVVERHEQRLAYREFLAARDGTVDFERRTLSRREEGMERYLGPISNARTIDRGLFDEQYARYDPRREMSREMLLLLTLVKVNAAEAYGVGRMIEPLIAKVRRDSDDLELVLNIEEDYHTKILLSTSGLYGMTVTAPYRPRTSLRALIGAMATAPHAMSRPIILVAELLGTLYFLDLLRVAREVLHDLPMVRDAVEERLTDVIIDEIGHVSFNRLCLGSMGLAQARMLCPIVAAGLGDVVPEFRTLGLKLGANIDRPLSERSELPEQVRRQAFFA
jgi:hypothetical protein